MPDTPRLPIKFKTPAIILTKSDLILRDYDLTDTLSNITYVNIAASITTLDEDLTSRIEPGGVESIRRFNVLKTFRKTNASIGLHVMPIIPYLTDGFENSDALFKLAKEAGVYYVLSGTHFKIITVFFGSCSNPMKRKNRSSKRPVGFMCDSR